jgi:hypothetical protein
MTLQPAFPVTLAALNHCLMLPACSAGDLLEVCFPNDRVIGAMAARRIQRVVLVLCQSPM